MQPLKESDILFSDKLKFEQTTRKIEQLHLTPMVFSGKQDLGNMNSMPLSISEAYLSGHIPCGVIHRVIILTAKVLEPPENEFAVSRASIKTLSTSCTASMVWPRLSSLYGICDRMADFSELMIMMLHDLH